MQRAGRFALIVFELALLTALIVATRCANYQDVFVAGNVYFVDADCYARMTRAHMVRAKPGTIIRHHAFENFPQGTTPHTTAPLDYLIVGLSTLILAAHPAAAPYHLDLAGAFVSPLLALLGGWFLWWWSRRMKFRYRWVMLILYAISPILVHGTELGRPDHQSLLILLVSIAICGEWTFQTLHATMEATDGIRESRMPSRVRAWAVTSGLAWAVAIWVSAYEPVVLVVILTATNFLVDRQTVFGRDRRTGWMVLAVTILVAFLIERRIPSFAIFQPNTTFKDWARTVGELAHVSPMNPAWLSWCGYLVVITPILIWINMRTRKGGAPGPRPPWTGSAVASGAAVPICILLLATCLLTVWQARWGYFFVLIFAIALPALLAPIKSPAAVWISVVLSMFPILRDWDQRLWPNETQLASRVERRIESAQIREIAMGLRSSDVHPFLAPWWLSPSIAYWSAQPGVAGSSHESLNGIEVSAGFFVSQNLEQAREILDKHHVAWVFAYDSERVAQNSATILNEPIPPLPLCQVLDRTPGQAPLFLIFSAQNPTCKLYRVARER